MGSADVKGPDEGQESSRHSHEPECAIRLFYLERLYVTLLSLTPSDQGNGLQRHKTGELEYTTTL